MVIESGSHINERAVFWLQFLAKASEEVAMSVKLAHVELLDGVDKLYKRKRSLAVEKEFVLIFDICEHIDGSERLKAVNGLSSVPLI